MDALIQDLIYSVRTFRLNPGFTFTALAALALGIGANTAIFSVVNAVLLQPLPYPHPERMVQLLGLYKGETLPYTSVPRFNAYRAQSQIFEAVAAYDWTGGAPISLTGGDHPEQLRGEHVSLDYFRLFGAPFIAGRAFNSQEDHPGGGRSAVLSSGLWQRRFASDPSMVGKTILLGGDPYTVIGIVSSSYAPDQPVDIWLPLQADPNSADYRTFLFAAARLKPGVTLDQARAALHLAADEFRRKFPDGIGPTGSFTAEPLLKNLTGDVRLPLLVLLGAVACVLMIACANVANLMLARSAGRTREMAVRAAIGAGRGRILRQLLTESVLLSLTGGTLGLLLGVAAIRALLTLSEDSIPRLGHTGAAVTLDVRVLAFTLLISILTGILFGLAPAIHASCIDLQSGLKEGGSRSGSRRHNRTRGLIIVAEIALAFVLLTSTGLLIRTFVALQKIALGFNAHRVLTMESALNGARFDSTSAIANAVNLCEQRIAAIPGVEAVAVAPSVALESSLSKRFQIEGRQLGDRKYDGGAWWRYVTWRYFDVYKIPILRGRGFTARDDADAPPVVVIDQAMALKYWPSGNPIGQRIRFDSSSQEPYREIVGVVGDVRELGLRQDGQYLTATYIPLPQVADATMEFVKRVGPLAWAIRTSAQPFSLSLAVQHEIQSAAGLSVDHVRSMDQVVSAASARDRFNTVLIVIFAVVAVLLASIGLHGVISYSIEQRAQEFGIRLALGATPSHLRNKIVRQAMALAISGMLIGVAAALALTRLMASMLYGVKGMDPLVFASVALAMFLVALAASFIPARRAERIDPVVALRSE